MLLVHHQLMFHLVFCSVMILPAYFSRSDYWSKITLAVVLFALIVGVVSMSRRSKPEFLITSILVLPVLFGTKQSLKRALLVLMLCLPVISALVERPFQEALPVIPVPESMVAQANPPTDSRRDNPLTQWLGKSADRPLALVEYPLGFSALWPDRVATATVVVGHYLRLMVVPWPQSFYYGYSVFDRVEPHDPRAMACAAIIVVLMLLAAYGAYHRSVWSFGLISMLISIAVFSNLFEPVAGMAGDRLTYVASFGYCIALGYALTWLYERQRSTQGRSMVAVSIVLLLVIYSGMTIARNAQWKDALTLMRHDIENVPNSAQAHNLLASHLMKNSFEPEYQQEAIAMRLEAIDHFKEAVRIWPEFFNVWYDLGRVYLIIDDPESALPCFKEAHRLDSTYYDATFNVAMIADKRGDATTAITYYEKCIRINPEMLPPYNELSYLLYRLGEYEASIAVNEKAIAYNANWPDPYKNIAQTYAAMNQPEKGQAYLQRLENMK